MDPAAAGPSGFYWLDTTGAYQLPGGQLHFACSACHGTAGGPPSGAGKVLPLRHVNGRREVVFDPRTTLPDLAWLPPATGLALVALVPDLGRRGRNRVLNEPDPLEGHSAIGREG